MCLYFLGDAPPPSSSSPTAPLSVPVGVPPGLEYLAQVILLYLIYSCSLSSMGSLNNQTWSLHKISDWPGPDSSESGALGRWICFLPLSTWIFTVQVMWTTSISSFREIGLKISNSNRKLLTLLALMQSCTFFLALLYLSLSIHRFWDQQSVCDQEQHGPKDLQGQREEWLLHTELLWFTEELWHED